jgi:hypothetical protein
VLFIYLCHGFPIVVREDERRGYDGHQLVAVFGDPMVAWLTYQSLRREAAARPHGRRPAGVDPVAHAHPTPRRRASDARATAARRPGS